MTKKNKIYVAIIVVCVLITAGVFMFGAGGSSTPPATTVNPTPVTATPRPTPTGSGKSINTGNTDFPAPSVFPADTNFDTSVLDSGDFSRLKDYTPVTVTPEELGKEDLF